MLIALLTDIHANMPALDACLAEALKLRAERFVFLGDLVGYGPDPQAVVDKVRKLAEQGAIAVQGNHDEAAARTSEQMNSTAARAIAWTREHLDRESKSWLAALPLEVSDGANLFVHADGSNPSAWNYVTDADGARVSLQACSAHATFCGHVHVPALYCLAPTGKLVTHRPVAGTSIPLSTQRKWLCVLGSVGQPRDGNPASSFATYNTKTMELIYRRAPYDCEDVARRVLAAGLPEKLADRLLKGV